MEALLVLLALAWTVGIPTVAIVALIRTGNLREQSERLARDIAALRRDMAARPPVPPPLDPVVETVVVAPVIVAPAIIEPVVVAPMDAAPFEPETPPTPVWDPPPSSPVAAKAGWEERLGARAFIWVGAITLALSAVFLVRYSIEEGYLSPEIRVILAALFGAGLVAGAEKMRGREDWTAQGMAAAGIAALYGSLLSAVALYEMVSRPMAGVAAMALTSFAIAVSLRHGIFVAALAFVGGFASPAIIGSDAPNTPALFGYLLTITAGTLWVIRLRGWWVLGWGVLAGAVLWTCIWRVLLHAGVNELHWIGGFLVAVAGLFVWAAWERMRERENPPKDVVAQLWTALGVTGVAVGGLVVDDNGLQLAGWLALALHGLGAYALARLVPRFQYAAVLAPVLSLATLALWWADVDSDGVAFDADRFATMAILFGALYAGGAFALMWNAGRPGFWAALSVAAALAHFLLCWRVLRGTTTGVPWGLISIGLAAPFLVGAERLVRWRESMPGATEALGFLAAGISFFIAAAVALEFNREWITVAYAVELAAVAAIAWKLDLVAMRRLCWVLLAVVVVRFVLNPEVLRYPLTVAPILNWILWGYGISIAALLVGAHYLRRVGNDRLVLAVEASAALLAFVLVTLEVRSLFHRGSMDAPEAAFTERSFYVLIWGAFALAALWTARTFHHIVALWAWRLGGILAAGVALLIQTLLDNPVVSPVDLGRLPIANGLILTYALPAAMAALARRWTDVEADKRVGQAVAVVALVLAFAYISFEVRHLFDPAFERPGFGAEGLELYTYSIVWLIFGVTLLAVGAVRRLAALRHAGMALVCLVVAKVFLVDMAGLQGLLRVVSFLGLGMALMGLGYAYRRYGFDPTPPAKTEP